MSTNLPTPEPFNVMDETRWVSREAARLMREGGDPDERATYFARKARLMLELARLSGDVDEAGEL